MPTVSSTVLQVDVDDFTKEPDAVSLAGPLRHHDVLSAPPRSLAPEVNP
jgi:hypothetical protein